ncbi:integral-membrane protein [Rhodopirellula baltica SWK14]|uniref:Integral-membrane protein n=2 Tax=Rhodopirellula baltica TaxID=265606 RepID=L7CFE5_RHOBT|nr:integral-membrane protein [Rhodopirellula baltica SWK14]
MPGIGRLNDRSFIRAFQVIDGVIQDNQPFFMFVWIGSAIAIVVAAVIGFLQIDGVDRTLLIAAAVVYLLGVQLPTVRINIPLNNKIQAIDVEQKDDQELLAARADFEDQWNRWNVFRTVVSIAIALSLHVLLLRI